VKTTANRLIGVQCNPYSATQHEQVAVVGNKLAISKYTFYLSCSSLKHDGKATLRDWSYISITMPSAVKKTEDFFVCWNGFRLIITQKKVLLQHKRSIARRSVFCILTEHEV